MTISDMGAPEEPIRFVVQRGKQPAPRPHGPSFLGMPVQVVVALAIQTVTFAYYLGQQSSRLQVVIDQTREVREEVYRQSDASRDLARRDDRIADLSRRIEILEQGYARKGHR